MNNQIKRAAKLATRVEARLKGKKRGEPGDGSGKAQNRNDGIERNEPRRAPHADLYLKRGSPTTIVSALMMILKVGFIS